MLSPPERHQLLTIASSLISLQFSLSHRFTLISRFVLIVYHMRLLFIYCSKLNTIQMATDVDSS